MKDGSWRPRGDFHHLNLATQADKYLVPNLADFLSQLKGCTIFNTMDLKNGYLQVPREQSVVPKTAVITPFSLFEFLHMPFGLKNTGMTFQRFMDQIFHGLDFIYINDILVAIKSRREHITQLSEVLSWLRHPAWCGTCPSAPLATPLWISWATKSALAATGS